MDEHGKVLDTFDIKDEEAIGENYYNKIVEEAIDEFGKK